jgi:hypothetical protein
MECKFERAKSNFLFSLFFWFSKSHIAIDCCFFATRKTNFDQARMEKMSGDSIGKELPECKDFVINIPSDLPPEELLAGLLYILS